MFSTLAACLVVANIPIDRPPETKTIRISGYYVSLEYPRRIIWIGDKKNPKPVYLPEYTQFTINGEKNCTLRDVGHLMSNYKSKATFTQVSDGVIEMAELAVVTEDVNWRDHLPPRRLWLKNRKP